MNNALLYVFIVILICLNVILIGTISFINKAFRIEMERIDAHSDSICSLFDHLIETNNEIIKLDERIKELSNEDKCEG